MVRKKLEEAPYDENGNLMSFPGYGSRMLPVDEFEGTLRIVAIERGQSAARFRCVDDATGLSYPMFMKDLFDALICGTVEKGRIEGSWTVSKFGKNYGIRLADVNPEELK